MPHPIAPTSRTASALVLGLLAAALVAALHLAGADERLELMALDQRFRHCCPDDPMGDIVVVAIDDSSIEEVGRWPWPRGVLADVIDTLHECGARRIGLDIVFPEPQAVRYVSAEAEVLSPHSGGALGDARPRPVFDDAALAAAIARAGDVLAPVFVNTNPREQDRALIRLAETVAEGPDMPFDAVRAQEPNLPAEQVRRAYLRGRALAEVRKRLPPVSGRNRLQAPRGAVVPPFLPISSSARYVGAVNNAFDVDGAVRRIPLVTPADGGDVPHFALTLAAADAADPRLYVLDGHVALADGAAPRLAIPTDRRGAMLVNWTRSRDLLPARLPAAYRLRQSIRLNADAMRQRGLRLARLLQQQDLLDLYARADALYQRRLAAEVQRMRAFLYNPAEAATMPAAPAEEERRVEAQLTERTEALLAEMDFYLQALPAEDPLRREAESLRGGIREAQAANTGLRAELDERKAQIRRRVHGKICLIGSTATSAPDFVPTPIDEHLPGVLVHANALHTIRTGRFLRTAPAWLNACFVLLLGGLTTLIASRKPVWLAAPAAAVLVAGCAAGAAAAFRYAGLWVAAVAPAGGVLASFVAVTAWRQLTEERAKRRIRGIFARAYSPELVDQLIADPALLQPGGERRVLTCFFSDLAGFTSLSERLGEQRTVRVLNHYFDHMTDVIRLRHGGYINKFLGDGLFVLFGAPVPQEDHAHRAIHAALDCEAELVRLNAELAEEHDVPVSLSIRVGIATGEVMVGNCGPTEGLDYTAIGDTVNFASRLESANKAFGTGILVAGRVWEQGGQDEFLVRSLGRIVVVGREGSEPVRHLKCYRRQASMELQKAYVAFTEAVELYAQMEFAAAAAAMEGFLAACPGDKPAALYLDLCRRHMDEPPGDDWDPAIHLTEK